MEKKNHFTNYDPMRDKCKYKQRKEDSSTFGICLFKILKITVLLFYLVSFEAAFKLQLLEQWNKNTSASIIF